MTKTYIAIPADEVTSAFSPKRKGRIAARAAELIAEEVALRDIRKSRHVSQEQIAKRLGGKQVYISRLEKRADVKLSTLRNYVQALGGELQLMVTFPEGAAVAIKDIGGAPKRKPVSAKLKAMGAKGVSGRARKARSAGLAKTA
jgi:Helix-turn-helix domain